MTEVCVRAELALNWPRTHVPVQYQYIRRRVLLWPWGYQHGAARRGEHLEPVVKA